jgi:hypothetical protein
MHSGVRQTTSVTGGQFIGLNTGEVLDTQQDRQIGQQVASAIEPAVDLSASRQTMVSHLTRVPNPPRSYELFARKVAPEAGCALATESL